MIQLKEERVKFVCGLSNGETLIEGQGVLSKDGTDSPWWKLQKYLKNNNAEITSMSLVSKTPVGNRHYHLPNGIHKFTGIESLTPKGYSFFRRGESVNGNTLSGQYAVIEADYGEYKVQLWVSEIDPDKSWVNLVGGNNGK